MDGCHHTIIQEPGGTAHGVARYDPKHRNIPDQKLRKIS